MKKLNAQEIFSIRKLSTGIASVGIAMTFIGGQVAADEVTESEPVVQDQGVEIKETETPTVYQAEPVVVESVLIDQPVPEKSVEMPDSQAQRSAVADVPVPVSGEGKSDPIEEGSFRVHFKELPSENVESLGLWSWDDVEVPSSDKGGWPTGATSFAQAGRDDYGYYMDVRMKGEQAKKISMLINNTAGENLTGDKTIERISSDMNQAWFDQNFKLSLYKPLQEGYLRINYFRTDGNYDQKSLWLWGDVADVQMGDWPDGVDFEHRGQYGVYRDVKLTELANSVGFLLLDESQSGDAVKIQPKDYNFSDLKNHTQIFLKDDDATIYTNPYYINDVRVLGAAHNRLDSLEATFTTLDGISKEDLLEKLSVVDKDAKSVVIRDLVMDPESKKVQLLGDFSAEGAGYTLKYGNDLFLTKMGWQLKDQLYGYQGELGARVSEQGRVVDLTLWSPSAEQVDLVLYDKRDPNRVVGTLPLTRGDKGQWDLQLNLSSGLGIEDYRGYFYHYQITRQGEKVLVLDPYAKSLAAWNSELADQGLANRVAKAAIVDPSEVGPKGLNFASIPNFKQREDAVIYEAHVRDFTSDPAIAGELSHQFGTFAAFAERLAYLKELGVTHIQLLPVMSYYFVNELKNGERLVEYASSNSNYNWGYDPQSYFALGGMYSTDPSDPMKRIQEFKNLVHEIHKQGMGVILDVVYNHTAKTFLFEDLEPNYYHFMESDGTAKSSFGGGRLGTTHHMSRRVLVDSIKYLVDEYKVDGFRFDMMGDHDAEAIELAFAEAKKLNPNIIMLGEGWRTFTGDTNQTVKPADQDWMSSTDTVAVFSDEIRNTLKSGYPNEGQPAFITGAPKNLESVFNNIKAQPGNFLADDPGDVIQYIAAHDNLTLFDIIAQSIKKDPSKPENAAEIHQRQRLGNLLVLTSQGTPFIHSGQEYGRTKQFRHPDYRYPVSEEKVPNKAHLLSNADGSPFDYPYFIHDSYDSSDAVNKFDWSKATNANLYPDNVRTHDFTKGLIALRKSSDAFRLGTKEEVDKNVTLLTIPGQNGIGSEDLVIGYQTVASNGDRYAVFVNADSKERTFVLSEATRDLLQGQVLVDGARAGTQALTNLQGVSLGQNSLTLAPLTATVLLLRAQAEQAQTTTKEKVLEEQLPVEEEVVYDSKLPQGYKQVLQEGQAGKKISRYLETWKDGQLIENILVSETIETGQKRIVVVGTARLKEVEQTGKGNPTTQENPSKTVTMLKQASAIEQTTEGKEKLPNTGEQSSLLALLGVNLAAISAGLLRQNED